MNERVKEKQYKHMCYCYCNISVTAKIDEGVPFIKPRNNWMLNLFYLLANFIALVFTLHGVC